MIRNMINLNKETRYAYNMIKMLGINNDGIIYGGMVRDEIIATHHKLLFDNYNADEHEPKYFKFWDTTYHPESINRLLIPNDMDIYFKNNNQAQLFMSKLADLSRVYNGSISTHSGFLYSFGQNFIHKKIIILFRVGRSLCNNGHSIKLNIDIIINNNSDNVIEPPFNNGDFTCNLFIMVKSSHNRYDIRLSKNTGTILDTMPFIKKIQIQSKILTDLMNGNTEFIRNIQSPDTEYVNGLRILKMINHSYNIKISNLLFIEIDYIKIDNICDICQVSFNESSHINNNDSLIQIMTNKHATNIMHKKCFKKYLESEIFKKYKNPNTNEIECKCTRRNLFNFKNSYKYSSLYSL